MEESETYLVHKNGLHSGADCFIFKNKDDSAKVSKLRENRTCFSCLKIGHSVSEFTRSVCDV